MSKIMNSYHIERLMRRVTGDSSLFLGHKDLPIWGYATKMFIGFDMPDELKSRVKDELQLMNSSNTTTNAWMFSYHENDIEVTVCVVVKLDIRHDN